MSQHSETVETVSARAAPVADARRLTVMIDRLGAAEPDRLLACVLEELVMIVRGEAGVGLLATSGTRIRASTEPGWRDDHLDPALCEALDASFEERGLGELPASDGTAADGDSRVTRELLGGSGRLTVVPLVAGDSLLGWVLVRSGEGSRADEITRATAEVTGRIAGALIGHLGSRALPEPSWAVRTPEGTPAHRVVVVEDDVDVAEGLRAALATEGYEVEVTGTADEALATLRRAPPSLVILDVSLPDGDGFGIARSLATHRRTAHVPVLFLSGVDDLATRVRRLHLEETDFIQKPFSWKELLTRVDQSILRAEHRNQLLFSAHTDELTGLGNRRLLEERLATEAARAGRYGTPISIAVLDVDRLKSINDRHGHAAGSAVLRAVGDALRHAVRETDLAARYGGDEFVVLLPHTDLEHAMAFANRVLASLRTLRPSGLPVSVSIGVAALDETRDASVQDLFERADQTAYRAKREGGDRVCVDPNPARSLT
jgi:two-component system, cell cycle response regulator